MQKTVFVLFTEAAVSSIEPAECYREMDSAEESGSALSYLVAIAL